MTISGQRFLFVGLISGIPDTHSQSESEYNRGQHDRHCASPCHAAGVSDSLWTLTEWGAAFALPARLDNERPDLSQVVRNRNYRMDGIFCRLGRSQSDARGPLWNQTHQFEIRSQSHHRPDHVRDFLLRMVPISGCPAPPMQRSFGLLREGGSIPFPCRLSGIRIVANDHLYTLAYRDAGEFPVAAKVDRSGFELGHYQKFKSSLEAAASAQPRRRAFLIGYGR